MNAKKMAENTVTIDPSVNNFTLNKGDVFNEDINVKIPAMTGVPKVDVYLLSDLTISMKGVLRSLKARAKEILSELTGLGLDVAFGVGGYRDFTSSRTPNDVFLRGYPVSTDTAGVETAINSWSTATGGAEAPECSFYALDQLAQAPGGTVGWRQGSKRIIVWFGDVPSHNPVGTALTGLSYDISQESIIAKLEAEKITVLAISTTRSTGNNRGLDGKPTSTGRYIRDNSPEQTHVGGQATALCKASGGEHVVGIDTSTIADTILRMVQGAMRKINHVSLVPQGEIRPFVESTEPAALGPFNTDSEQNLTFKVSFKGVEDCGNAPKVFNGSLDVIADGSTLIGKPVTITVDPCPKPTDPRPQPTKEEVTPPPAVDPPVPPPVTTTPPPTTTGGGGVITSHSTVTPLIAATEHLNRASIITVLDKIVKEIDEHCRKLDEHDERLVGPRDEFLKLINDLRVINKTQDDEIASLKLALTELRNTTVNLTGGLGDQIRNIFTTEFSARQPQQLTLITQQLGDIINTRITEHLKGDVATDLEERLNRMMIMLENVKRAANELDDSEVRKVREILNKVIVNLDLGPIVAKTTITVNGNAFSLQGLLALLAGSEKVAAIRMAYGADGDLSGCTFILTDGSSVVFMCTRANGADGSVRYYFTTDNWQGVPASFVLGLRRNSIGMNMCRQTLTLDSYNVDFQTNVVFDLGPGGARTARLAPRSVR